MPRVNDPPPDKHTWPAPIDVGELQRRLGGGMYVAPPQKPEPPKTLADRLYPKTRK